MAFLNKLFFSPFQLLARQFLVLGKRLLRLPCHAEFLVSAGQKAVGLTEIGLEAKGLF